MLKRTEAPASIGKIRFSCQPTCKVLHGSVRNTDHKGTCMSTHVPLMEVLWCMSFHTTTSARPVVWDVPTVNISPASKALLSNYKTRREEIVVSMQAFKPFFISQQLLTETYYIISIVFLHELLLCLLYCRASKLF